MYVRDAGGNVMSIYEKEQGEQSADPEEMPLYGSSRIGVMYAQGGSPLYTYELFDHLGNARAIVERDKDASDNLQLVAINDYYPFGWKLPNRTFESLRYRFGYQGQFAEEDEVTEMSLFELRQWDGRVGRWANTDLYNQFYSPYLGMGNNPILKVDFDGGFASPPDDHYYDRKTGEYLYTVQTNKPDRIFSIKVAEIEASRNYGFFHFLFNKNKYFRFGGDISFGVQAGIGFKVNDVNLKVKGNIVSTTLYSGSLTQIGDSDAPWEFTDRYISENGIYTINNGVAVPLLGYEHSFDTKGTGHIRGTEIHQFNVGPVVIKNKDDPSASLRFGFEGALLLGGNVYVEFGVK